MSRFGCGLGLLALLGAMGVLDEKEGAKQSNPRVQPDENYRPPNNLLDAWMEKSYGIGAPKIISTIKSSGKLYVPAVEMKEKLLALNTTPETAGNVKWNDVDPQQIHMARVTLPDGGQVNVAAAYTDAKLLKLEFIEEHPAREWLESILRWEGSDGITFNPNTRFLREDVGDRIMMTGNRFALAEIIGYLDSTEEDPARPYHELANQAFASGRHFETLYWWGRAYRGGRPIDDWKKAEESKLRAYYALDFPDARNRSRSELNWMLEAHPDQNLEHLKLEFVQ